MIFQMDRTVRQRWDALELFPSGEGTFLSEESNSQMDAANPMVRVFISHSSKDKELAEALPRRFTTFPQSASY